jgi:NAD(P)H-dependent FMN reductase
VNAQHDDRPVLQVIVGSTRPGRVGRAVAEWFCEQAVSRDHFRVELVDLAEIDLPLFDEPGHPRLGRYEHEHTRRWSETVARADAFAFVIPEYNHGINAAIKNAIDYLYAEWLHKPAGIVSYGGISGGLRAAEMIRPILSGLKVVPMVESVIIPFIRNHIDGGRFHSTESIDRSARSMLDELVRWTEAMGPLREDAR